MNVAGRDMARALASALALAGLVAATPAPRPLAILASVKGHADVIPARGGSGATATFGATLERGDRIVVAAGGAVTVLLDDGSVVELGEKSAMTVGARPAARPKADLAPALPGEVVSGVSQFVAGGSRETGLMAMSTLRSGPDDAPLLLSPRHTELLDGRPAFRWRAAAGATRYRLAVSGEQGELWSREVAETTLAYPAEVAPLAADADYVWEVRALADKGEVRREESSVHVLGAQVADGVRASLARIGERTGGAESQASRFLAGSYLSSRGLLRDAAEQLEALTRLTPEAAGVHESLGNVYRAMGLMDLAASEYQRALALQRAR